MRTVEECYEYVIARRNERAAQRRKRRELVLKAAVPVCGISVMVGVGLVMRSGIIGMTETGDISSLTENSIANNESTTSSTVTSDDNSSGESSTTVDTSQTSAPDDKSAYDDVFEGINGNSSTGAPMSYDEVLEMITSPLQKENGIFLDSFYLVETVRAIPYEEARELNGWTEVCEGKTVYEVRVLSDLISSEEINRTEKIIVANGTVEWQKGGDPVYASGERFTVVLTKPQEGCDFLHTPSSITFRYDVVESEEGTMLYSRGSEIDKLNLPTSEKLDEKVIKSTTQNPVHYTQKLSLNALVEFLRSDWKQRGMSSHFENNYAL